MRRISQFLFNALSLLSLALCVATAGFLECSYINTDHFWLGEGFGRTDVTTARGRLLIQRQISGARGQLWTEFFHRRMGWGVTPWMYENTSSDSTSEIFVVRTEKHHWIALGLERNSGLGDWGDYSPNDRWWSLAIPYWMLLIVFAILPLRWRMLLRRRRMRRNGVRLGRCGQCDYDMRATPAQCPECGTVAATASGRVRSWKGSVVTLAWRAGAAALTIAIVVFAFGHYQAARVAQGLDEARRDEIDDISESFHHAINWLADDKPGSPSASGAYFTQSLIAGLEKLRTHPDLEHPWLALAMIYRRADDATEIIFAVVDHPRQMDMVEIFDADGIIGAFPCSRNIRTGYKRTDLHGLTCVQWIDANPPFTITPREQSISLPHVVLSHRLRARLVGSDAAAIPIFVDPILLLSPTSRPAPFRRIEQ